jgi:hypothetical protein
VDDDNVAILSEEGPEEECGGAKSLSDGGKALSEEGPEEECGGAEVIVCRTEQRHCRRKGRKRKVTEQKS